MTKEGYWNKNKTKLRLNERSYSAFEMGVKFCKDQIADIKANCDLAIEGRDIKIKELELELTVEKDQHQEEVELHLHAEDYIRSLEQQIEKMKADVKQGQSYWNSGEMQYDLYQRLLDKWEIKEND